MYYVSTRDASLRYTAAQAIVQGLSREGGLFLPSEIPQLSREDLTELTRCSYPERAAHIMGLYLDDFSQEELLGFAEKAYGPAKFDTPAAAPVVKTEDGAYVMELWHGPTCAFKDMALQMLPYLLTASLRKTGEQKTVCILVATSGDTGKAALEGFRDVEHTKILVFYPDGGVSDIQKLQMVTQEGGNVGVCAVRGNFDDAQTGVKTLFSDVSLREELAARGYFLSTGTYDRNRPFYQTASPSMDILISSNLERLLYLLSGSDEAVRGYMAQLAETGRYTVSEEIKNAIQSVFACGFCDDAGTEAMIGEEYKRSGYLLDTHTAVAYRVAEQFRRADGSGTPMIVASTASPFKFCASVLDALGCREHRNGTAIIGQLAEMSGRPAPAPLAGLAGKQVRFGEVVDKGAMRAVVTEFLQ